MQYDKKSTGLFFIKHPVQSTNVDMYVIASEINHQQLIKQYYIQCQETDIQIYS